MTGREAGDVADRQDRVGWPHVPIGTLCERTAVEDPHFRPSFHYIDISSIDRIGKNIVETQELEGAAAPSRARKAIRVGDVRVSTVRPNLNAVAVVPDHLGGAIASTGFAVLRANTHVLLERYLFYYCCTSEFVTVLSTKVRGAQYPAVSDEDVRSVSIPLPPLSEQRRIVDVLDQADRLRRLRAEADAKADRILPALFIKMFGDPTSNPMAWDVTTLGDQATELRYGTSMRCGTAAVGVPVLRIPNIIRGKVNTEELKYCELSVADLKQSTLTRGDLLFVRTNGNPDYVGRCAVFDDDQTYSFASYLIRVRLNREGMDPWFVAAFLQTPLGRRAMAPFIRTTAGQSNINTTGLRQIPIPAPPVELERRFHDRLTVVEHSSDQRGQASPQLAAIFTSLLHRAFTGDLTASWRQAHMKELLQEMETQAKTLGKVE